MIHSLVFGMVIASAQPVDADIARRINFTTRATRCDEVVARLREISGLDLTCTPAVADSVLLCRVIDEPIKEVLNRVATAANGYWKVTEGKWSLRANSPVPTNDYAERVKLIQDKKAFLKTRQGAELSREKLVQYATRSVTMSSRFDDPNAWADPAFRKEFEEIRRVDPNNTGVAKLFLRLNTDTLAKIGKSQRMVWSTRPTRMQAQLPPDLFQAMERWKEDSNTWNDIMRRGLNPDADADPSLDNSSQKIVAMRLVVSRGSYDGDQMSLAFQLNAQYQGSENWEWLAADSIDLNPASNVDPDFNKDPIGNPGVAKPGETVYKIAEENQPLSNWLQQVYDEPQRAANSVAMRKFFGDPRLKDPLSFGATDILMAYLEDAKLEAVVQVPDSLFGYNRTFEGYDYTRRSLEEALKSYGLYTDLAFETKNGWWTISKKKGQVATVTSPMSRSGLAELIDRAAQGDTGSLDFKANVAALILPDDGSSYTMLYCYLGTVLTATDLNATYADRKVMEFYRALGSTEKGAVVKDRGLRYGQLNAKARGVLDSMVYGAGASLMRVEDEPAAGDWNLGQDHESDVDWGSLPEPTEVLSNGIHPDSVVKFSLESNPVIEVTDDANSGAVYQVSPADIGAQEFYQSRPDLFPWINEEGSPRYSQFREARSGRYRFYVRLNGVVSITRYIATRTEYKQEKAGPKSSLSKETLDAIKKGFESAKKEYEANEGKDGGSTDGPPRHR
jgi:hypothetical protein